MTKKTEFNIVYLSLGSNVGDKFLHLSNAIKQLRNVGMTDKISPVFETKPWGFDSNNKFYNIVIKFITHLSPDELLKKIKEIEIKLGRTQKTHNKCYSDRTIDIDILFYNNIILSSEELTIPHPLLTERDFVLIPLHCIEPDLVHPILKKTIKLLCEEYKNSEIKQLNKQLF